MNVLARYLKAIAIGNGNLRTAAAFAEARDDWSTIERQAVVRMLKAAVSDIGTSDISGHGTGPADFMAAVRPLTLVGRLPVRRVPPLLSMLTQTVGSQAHWVGESKARRLCVGTYARDSLRLKQVAAMSVATKELILDRTLEGDSVLLADLLAACAEAVDRAFFDPANAGDDATPAAIAAGATPIPSSGGTIEDFVADATLAVQQLAAASNMRAAHWLMSSSFAATLGLTRAADGTPAFPTIGALGGTLAGLPVLTSQACKSEAESDDVETVVLVDADGVSYCEGAPTLKSSDEAMIEMSDAPTGATDAPTAATARLASMFQEEAIALYAAMSTNWAARRSGCVQVISGVPSELTPS